jgi:hypothetical protein
MCVWLPILSAVTAFAGYPCIPLEMVGRSKIAGKIKSGETSW